MGEFFSSVLETAPDVPKFKPIDIKAQTAETFSETGKYLPQAADLSGTLNNLMASQWQKLLSQEVPGYNNMMQGGSRYLQALMSGELPQEVQNQVQRSGAVRSLYGGYSGTGMGRNLVARDLGKTSLAMMGEGLDAATRWLGSARQSLASRFISPGEILSRGVPSTMERTGVAVEERNAQFQRDYASNLVDAHYSWSSRIGRGLDEALDIVMSMYGMGAMGGGGEKTSTS